MPDLVTQSGGSVLHFGSNITCPICRHGETKPGSATITLERGGMTLVIKDVPADACDTCGEAFHSEEVTRALLAQAERVALAGIEVCVRRYAIV